MHGVGALVFVTTAERVARAYAELWDKEPPGPPSAIARARNHAARQGWAPPAAWDDGDGPHGIDNPDATPVGVRGEYEPKRDLLAEVDHLRFCGLSLHEISRRLDVTVGAIERAWLRDGRRDFYAAMGASSAGMTETRAYTLGQTRAGRWWVDGAYSSPRVHSAQPGPAWKGRQGVRRLPVLAGPALTRGAR